MKAKVLLWALIFGLMLVGVQTAGVLAKSEEEAAPNLTTQNFNLLQDNQKMIKEIREHQEGLIEILEENNELIIKIRKQLRS